MNLVIKILASFLALIMTTLIVAATRELQGFPPVPVGLLPIIAAVIAWFLVPSKKAPLDETERSSAQGITPSADNKQIFKVFSSNEQPSRAIPTTHAAKKIADEHWAAALREYESDDREAGLYARLFASFEGSENRVKAEYLRVRSVVLANAEAPLAAQNDHLEADKTRFEPPVGLKKHPDTVANLVSEQRTHDQESGISFVIMAAVIFGSLIFSILYALLMV